MYWFRSCLVGVIAWTLVSSHGWADVPDFARDVQPLLVRSCTGCHGAKQQKSGYRLDVREIAFKGGDFGEAPIVPFDAQKSPLLRYVRGDDDALLMPPKKSNVPPLTAEEVAILTRWIEAGAVWPDAANTQLADKRNWWSFQPLAKVAVPLPATRNPVDAFITAKLTEKQLAMSPRADARTLIRRVYFDLIGLPPTSDEVDDFVTDSKTAPVAAYERLIDRLLASPRYGERWARHWLDVVHFGETHGYDKDQPRPNAWPYRDYVIRAFNEDKPYARFVEEQVAGDVLYPGTRDGIEALGFLSAGPWDFIGHAEVPEEKIDGKVARHLDRDDIVANTINTFASLTVHCAQCHDHKFDPIAQEDYYALQAVFAALDRADRTYDLDPQLAGQRTALQEKQRTLSQRVAAFHKQAREHAGEALLAVEKKIADLKKPTGDRQAQFGWHSAISTNQDERKWVQIDLGKELPLSQVVLHPCRDDFNGIGDGFGFPLRFKIEASTDAEFAKAVTVADETAQDFANPKIRAVSYPTKEKARFLRVTATKLALRQADYIFALSELEAFDDTGGNLALGCTVTSLDSIEAPVRWARTNLVDGWYPGADPAKAIVLTGDPAKLEQARRLILESMLGAQATAELTAIEHELTTVEKELAALPPPQRVFAGTIHTGSGTFKGTGANGGKPRPIFVLARGDVKKPGREVAPGTINLNALPARFELALEAKEGDRRVALAHWLTSDQHPLVWRSIVNRVWQYHFGRGLVDTPNDFGHMGGQPSHPELLDWLALTFRDEQAGSLKQLHRLIVTSAAYQQSSLTDTPAARELDGNNVLLWRQNRRRLEAEAIRDSVLSVAGRLDLTMGGPSFQDFIVTHPEHSPHYEYQLADPENPALHRRSIYRFLVRSQQQPWMATFDCADPSLLVDKRNQTISPLQALALLNNQIMVTMSKHFATRAADDATLPEKVIHLFRLALQRNPTAEELSQLTTYATNHGLANTCRVLLNTNEFAFVD